MNYTEWAFVDLENIGSLKNISIEKYDKIYVFAGSHQSNITLTSNSTKKFVELKILKIQETSKDNLDFHLSYYLGKFDSLAKKDIVFTVISNDTGFDNLIKHISNTGRKCKRFKIENKENKENKEKTKVLQDLLAKGSNKLPKTEKTLRNYIKSHLGNTKSEKKLETTYQYIIKNKTIANRINTKD